MNNGWIKLHRQLQESSFFGQPIPVAIWVHCLLRANHEPREWFAGREKISIAAGEFVMGYREFAEEIGCGVATLKAWLDLFEEEGMVERSRNAKGSTVKLKKWSEYQEGRTLAERSRNARGTLTEPYKKDKNIRKEETTTVEPRTSALLDYINSECQTSGLVNAVNARALDVQVRRYVNLSLKIECRKCITWLIEHGQKQITASRLANWFAKAQEINKRDELRSQERFLASKDPFVAAQVRARGEQPEHREAFAIDPALKAKLKSLPLTPNG